MTAGPASAHEASAGFGGGFLSGFLHPMLGLDHLTAMIAVGIWGAFLRKPAIWVLPIAFPLVMAFGGAVGVAGVELPYIEPVIAASSVVIGLAILSAWRAQVWLAALIVSVFAIFHGFAHGTELPHSANAAAFGMGFVIATGILHLTGIVFGLLVNRPGGEIALRTAGGVIAVTGAGFLFGVL